MRLRHPVLAFVLTLAGLALAATPFTTAQAQADKADKTGNPYAGARVYVNADWSARAAAEPGGQAVAGEPTAVWLDAIADVQGLRDHLDAALAQDADLIQLVLHDLPARDCEWLMPAAELTLGELPRYQSEFIDPIAEILADPAYAGLRVVTILEPGALASLITHRS
jgi:cellulose 1,4-beta-cellobiosidase